MGASIKISKFGIISSIFFVVFIVIGRFVYPFGDEPDFIVRSYILKYSIHDWWSPYYYFDGLIKQLVITSNCNINSGVLSLWSKIDNNTCTESIANILIRVFITIMISLPILLICVNPKISKFIHTLFNVKITYAECIDSSRVMSLCLLFPGILYYIGVLAIEQYVLALSLSSYFLWRIKLLIFFIFILIFLVDKGNSIVFISFYLMFYFLRSRLPQKLLKYKKTVISLLLFAIVLITQVGTQNILSAISSVSSFSDKSNSINEAYLNSDLNNKYPIYLRPIITYMTSIMSLPSGVKNIFGIIVSLLVFFPLLYRAFNRNTKNLDFLYAAFATILLFVFLLPTYANAKYYIWMLPFILQPVLQYVKPIKALVFLFMLSSSNLILLFLFRL